MTFAAEKAPGRTRLLEQLMSVVRPSSAPRSTSPPRTTPSSSPTSAQWRTATGQRPRSGDGLCNAHAIRFRKRGCPPMADFLSDPGPPVRGRRSLAACVIDGCRYGRGARNGLCSKHRDRWSRAGKPGLATWDAPDLAPSDTATVRVPPAVLQPVGRQPHQALLHRPR